MIQKLNQIIDSPDPSNGGARYLGWPKYLNSLGQTKFRHDLVGTGEERNTLISWIKALDEMVEDPKGW